MSRRLMAVRSCGSLKPKWTTARAKRSGYTMERLFAAGAREAHYVPVFMKKNRPAYQIQTLCAEEDIAALERVLFAETTTIGIRRTPMERTVLPRDNCAGGNALGSHARKARRSPGWGRAPVSRIRRRGARAREPMRFRTRRFIAQRFCRLRAASSSSPFVEPDPFVDRCFLWAFGRRCPFLSQRAFVEDLREEGGINGELGLASCDRASGRRAVRIM